MKKISIMLIAACGVIASVFADVSVYDFRSTMHVYSLAAKKYKTTKFNGTLTIEDGVPSLVGTIAGTKEDFELALEGDKLVIVAGNNNKIGAVLASFLSSDERLYLTLSGAGVVKNTVTGCTPCGDGGSTCTKIKSLSGNYTGYYVCPCDNLQYFSYDWICTVAAEKDENRSPLWGSWKAVLKTVDGVKFK